jgi:hypothetical protein
MQTCDYENFDITIRGQSAPYGVTARYLDQTADGDFNQELTHARWQRSLETMRQTLYAPTPRPMLDAGAQLFRDLFRGDVRDLWIAARSGLDRGRESSGRGLRLRLALQPPVVAALPWETLYDPDRNTVFGVSSRTQLVRVEQQYRRLSAPAPLAVKLPLRVLVAAPEDPEGIVDAPREIETVKRMLHTLGRDQIKIHTMTGRFSVVDLRRRLEKVRPQILHILTHGVAQSIQLWQSGRPRMVPAAGLRTTLERTPWVRFVFLNACLTGQNEQDDPLAALEPQLLQAGVPAVLAMQFEIRDDVATEFAHFLYEALLAGSCPGAIDAAVTSARAGLYALNDGEIGYATPVLWLNAPDGRIFTFDSLPDHARNGEDANGNGHHTAPSDAPDAIDIEAEEAWIAELTRELETLRVGPELEFVLAALGETLQTLRDLLDRLRNWDRTGRVQAYVDQTRAYRRRKAEALRLRRKLREALTK